MPDGVSDHELDVMPSSIPPNTLSPTVDSMSEDGFQILQQNEGNMRGLFLHDIDPSL